MRSCKKINHPNNSSSPAVSACHYPEVWISRQFSIYAPLPRHSVPSGSPSPRDVRGEGKADRRDSRGRGVVAVDETQLVGNDKLTTCRDDEFFTGSGAATLYGGPQDDILIPGATSYDTNLTALFDLMDEEAQLMAHATLEKRRKGIDENLEFRCRHRDGTDVWVSVRAAQTLSDTGEFLGTLATVVDISALRTARRDLELAQTISLAVGAAEDFRGALREVLSGIARLDGSWDYAEAWLPNPLDGTMSLEATWSKAESADADADAAAGRRFPSLPGAQFAKRVCDGGKPNRVDHFDEQPDEPDPPTAGEATGRACRSTLGVPVKAAHEVVAVLLLFATSQGAPDERPWPGLCLSLECRGIATAWLGSVQQLRLPLQPPIHDDKSAENGDHRNDSDDDA